MGPSGVWTPLLLVAFVAMTYLVHHYRGHPRWTATEVVDFPARAHDERRASGRDADQDADGDSDQDADRPAAEPSNRAVWWRFVGAAAIVLGAGWLCSGTADALAEQTGLGSAFVGATFLALATSLPELSTTVSASREGRYTAAISNIFGSNAFDISLLFVADILFFEGSIMAYAESSVVFIAAVAAVMTCIYL